MRRNTQTDINLRRLIGDLKSLSKKEKVEIWNRIATDLLKPMRQRREVNVYQIDKYAKDGETVIVPGKVLSVGKINRHVNVAAWNFSELAKKKISEKGKTMTIPELMKTNPKGKGVRILG